MKQWYFKPVRRDQAGVPPVDVRSKVSGNGYAPDRRGTQIVMPIIGQITGHKRKGRR